jgi:2-aminoethylphosphonate-pyruvate transaminase
VSSAGAPNDRGRADSAGSPPRYVLLNPGPVVTSPAVKRALGADVAHRDAAFTELLSRIEDRLYVVFRAAPETHSIVLLSGSATAVAEAALTTFVPTSRRVLVVSNGAFGERLHEIATVHGLAAAPLHYGWAEPLRVQDITARLDADPEIHSVAVIHHETSVGVLNPIGEIARVVRERGRRFIVDCVSSLGSEDVDVKRDQIDVAIACANKCLHSVAGLAFACVRRELWQEADTFPPRSVYLDLRRYRRFREELGQLPFTPAVAAAYALDAALDELLSEGLTTRIERYRFLARRMRDELTALGLEVQNDHARGASAITCVRCPPYARFEDLYAELRARGYILYDGKGPLRGRVFQVAHMGALSPAVLGGFLAELRSVLERLSTAAEVSR